MADHDLVTFLREQCDADEAEGVAWGATFAGHQMQLQAAWRRFVVELLWSIRCTPLLRVVARQYAGRPGYRAEWKP